MPQIDGKQIADGTISPEKLDEIDLFVGRNLIIHDHFFNRDLVSPMGSMGWSVDASGAGSAVSAPTEAGHPGIIALTSGTNALSFSNIFLGGNGSIDSIIIGGANKIILEMVCKITESILSTILEQIQAGLGAGFDAGGALSDGVYVRFDPSVAGTFAVVTANGGLETVQQGTTTVVINTWYRLRIEIDDPGGTPSAQLFINGLPEGSPSTTNIPTAALGAGMKVDSAGGASTSTGQFDYFVVSQDTDKED